MEMINTAGETNPNKAFDPESLNETSPAVYGRSGIDTSKLLMATTTHLSGSSRITFANQLFQLKKERDNLEERLQNLERENINMRACRKTGLSADMEDFEPVRSVLNNMDQQQQRHKGRDPTAATTSTQPHYYYYTKRPSRMRRGESGDIEKSLPKSSYAKLRHLIKLPSNRNKFHYN
jgi:hypothetical protein